MACPESKEKGNKSATTSQGARFLSYPQDFRFPADINK
jgi:hypothetical protein